MKNVGKTEWEIFPTQRQFLDAKEPEVLISGGAGSGKSSALCLKIAIEGCKSGNAVILARRYGNTIRRSTLVNLLDGVAPHPPILPKGTYDFNATTQTIKIHGGGTIYCVGLDDFMKLRSMSVGLVAIDEATEIEDIEMWEELKLRLRLGVGSLQIVGSTNPAGTSHWLYKKFVTNNNSRCKLITSNALENTTLPKRTRDALLSLTGNARLRMLEGQWTDNERCVYGEVLINNSIVTNLPKKEAITRWYCGLDYGYTNPCAIILGGLDGDGTLWIYDCAERSGMIHENIIKWVEKYRGDDPCICIDPSAASLIADFNAKGINAIKATNDVDIGIDRVRNIFFANRIKIYSGCMELLKSLRSYVYGKDGKPLKINDHSCDALRYMVNTFLSDSYENANDNKSWYIC